MSAIPHFTTPTPAMAEFTRRIIHADASEFDVLRVLDLCERAYTQRTKRRPTPYDIVLAPDKIARPCLLAYRDARMVDDWSLTIEPQRIAFLNAAFYYGVRDLLDYFGWTDAQILIDCARPPVTGPREPRRTRAYGYAHDQPPDFESDS